MANITIANRTIELNQASIISMVTIWVLASLLNIFGLVVIYLSRVKLLKVEFAILMALNITTTLFKILGVYQYNVMVLNPDLYRTCFTAILGMLTAATLTKSFMTLLFYSVFQVSTVSRSRLFLLLFNLTHNTRNFLIYEILMIVLQLAFSAGSVLMSALDTNECPDILSLLNKNILVKFLVFLAIPSFPPIFVYLFAIIYVCFFRFRQNKYIDQDQNFKKNFQLLLKFLTLAIIFFSSFLLQNIFYFSTFIFAGVNIVIDTIIGDLGFILYALQPVFLIYAHSILKSTLKSFIIQFF